MESGDVWSIVYDKFGTDSLDELFLILSVFMRETIDSEIYGCQSFYGRIISEDTDIGSRS